MKNSQLASGSLRCLKKLPARFEPKRNLLIPMLQFVQEEVGYLPEQAMKGIAQYVGIPESEVYGVATFYAQFRFAPVGKNTIVVCRGTACHVRGSARILRELERQLGIKPFETTPDMLFTLETIACVGSCALAPVMVVNGKVQARQTSAFVKKLIDRIRHSDGKKVAARKKRRKSIRRRASGARRKTKGGARATRRGVS